MNTNTKYHRQLEYREKSFWYVAKDPCYDPPLKYWTYIEAMEAAEEATDGSRVWIGPSLPSYFSRNMVVWNWLTHVWPEEEPEDERDA